MRKLSTMTRQELFDYMKRWKVRMWVQKKHSFKWRFCRWMVERGRQELRLRLEVNKAFKILEGR